MTRPYSETLAAAEGHRVPRHYCRCKDCEFIEPLALPGWENRSTWGFDNSSRSFVARLWPNGSRAQKPFASLPDDDWRVHWWPSCLALDITARTGTEPIAVLTALVLLDPAPKLRSTAEIERWLNDPPGATDEYRCGFRRALRWILGGEHVCPGSRRSWPRGIPTPQVVDAEYQLLDGRVYSQDMDEVLTQQYNGGGQAALWWALGHGDRWSGRSGRRARGTLAVVEGQTSDLLDASDEK